MKKVFRWCVLAFCIMISGAHATFLNFDGEGILVGARDVAVGGSLYSVLFQDGSCIELFSGCDEHISFVFQTPGDALMASQALLDQVFVDVFDENPGLIRGCTPSGSTLCMSYTPYERDLGAGRITIKSSRAINFALESEDRIDLAQEEPDEDLLPRSAEVYAVWMLQPRNAVPEGSVVSLLGIALVAAALARFRRTQNVSLPP